MKIAKLHLVDNTTWALEHDGRWYRLNRDLDALLAETDFLTAVREAQGEVLDIASTAELPALAPLDSQEVWAAGVTYQRSQQARKEESKGSDFYDRVYAAERPEIFFKATASRTVGPGEAVGIRKDSSWNVPEPELALVLNKDLKMVGFTIGNDLSSRDIEGENPLYLPQAKVYERCLGLGPWIVTADEISDPLELTIELVIERSGDEVFRGETSTSVLNRTLDDLCHYLGRANRYPQGVMLLTGTGIVPPDAFTLQAGDVVSISIANIGTLTNPVQDV